MEKFMSLRVFAYTFVAMLALPVGMMVADWYLRIPVAQYTPEGKCLRVLVIEANRPVVKPCSFIKEGDRYHLEYVDK